VTTTAPPPPPPADLLTEGFDAGTLSQWTNSNQAVLNTTHKQAGTAGVVMTTTSGRAYVGKTFTTSRGSMGVNVWLKVIQRPNIGTSLVHFKDASGKGLVSLNLRPTGELVLRDPDTGAMTNSGVILPTGTWERIQVVLDVNSSTGSIGVARNGTAIPTLAVSGAAWAGSGVARIELGDMGGQKEAKAFSFAFDTLTVS
jgi:hypothetical protein